MIESLKGVAALKELAALAQNLEKKLGLPVSVEVLQKLLETKDGYKYLANIDGKLTEMLSKKELEVGSKYWADGVKNQLSNTLTLENLVQKPHILQSDIFKSDTLSKALGFNKLVEVVRAEIAKNIQPPAAQMDTKTQPQSAPTTQQTPTMQTQKSETPKAQTQAPEPQTKINEPKADMLQKNVTKLAAADTELAKSTPQIVTKITTKNSDKEIAKEVYTQKSDAKMEADTKEQTPSQAAKAQIASIKAEVAEKLKITTNVEPTKQKESAQIAKEEPKIATPTQVKNGAKEIQKEPESSAKFVNETMREKLKEFKHILGDLNTQTKMEPERAKSEAPNIQKEQKSNIVEAIQESIKAEITEKLLATLVQNFEGLDKGALFEAAQKIADLIFGKLPEHDTDEATLKILEYLEKQLEQKEAKEMMPSKKGSHLGAQAIEMEEITAKSDDVEANPKESGSKTNNPASKLKAQLLEELAKVGSKSEFQILSNVAMALNKEVFTFVLKDKGILQFKKRGEKGLNAKTVEFYSAFETLGPISGVITHIDGHTSLALNVEFESTYNFLKENLKELSFFDHKNVSIMHGIKEIVEIRSSFLDTMG